MKRNPDATFSNTLLQLRGRKKSISNGNGRTALRSRHRLRWGTHRSVHSESCERSCRRLPTSRVDLQAVTLSSSKNQPNRCEIFLVRNLSSHLFRGVLFGVGLLTEKPLVRTSRHPPATALCRLLVPATKHAAQSVHHNSPSRRRCSPLLRPTEHQFGPRSASVTES